MFLTFSLDGRNSSSSWFWFSSNFSSFQERCEVKFRHICSKLYSIGSWLLGICHEYILKSRMSCIYENFTIQERWAESNLSLFHSFNQRVRRNHSIPSFDCNQTQEWNGPILMEWNHDITFYLVSQPNTSRLRLFMI